MTSNTFLDQWIRNHFFDAVPICAAVIDRDYNLLYANKTFEDVYGDWRNRKCFSAYKKRDQPCGICKGSEAFSDGISRVSEETGYDQSGRMTRYIKHTIPVREPNGRIPYLLEMSIDITEANQVQRERKLLFDEVPCHIVLMDRQFRIVRANKKVRENFGEVVGQYCFEALKGLGLPCEDCTARQTFTDGKIHVGTHVWRSGLGHPVHHQVTTLPVPNENGTFDVVMEMTIDVSETMELHDRLNRAHHFMETLIHTAIDGVLAMDETGNVTILNPAARRLFGIQETTPVSGTSLTYMLPEGAIKRLIDGDERVFLPDSQIQTTTGETCPVRLSGARLQYEDQPLGMAFYIQDLTTLHQLEQQKLEAERLAAVGQTVAGLAHGVKNLITALEGGLYMLSSGMQKANIERMDKGLDMLARNIERISVFVKAFLGFAKGRHIRAWPCAPAAIAAEVVDLHSPKAHRLGIELRNEPAETDIPEAPIDYESMLECLTNLVGNAIDACQMSDRCADGLVRVRTFEERGVITYEVIDNGCGMDYEVKKKVFTNFFTTKGTGGTGLGLLTTKKIVQEHGGIIEMETEPGQGTTFRIRLPRSRLPKPASNGDAEPSNPSYHQV